MDKYVVLFFVSTCIAALLYVLYVFLENMTSTHRRRMQGLNNNKDLIIEIIKKAEANVDLYSPEDIKELCKELEFASKFFRLRLSRKNRYVRNRQQRNKTRNRR